MIEAFGEHLVTIDELRARRPDLRTRETNLRNQIDALDGQLADRDAFLALAADLEGFLTPLRDKAEVSTVEERQRVLRLLFKDVLVGPDKVTIRHRIPIRERTGTETEHTQGGSHVHQVIDRSGRYPAVLRQHNHATPQTFGAASSPVET